MTESEWLTSTDPTAMVEFAQNATASFRTRWLGWLTRKRFAISERKMRLLGCAIAARVAQLVPEGPIREFLDVVEEWVEGNASLQRVVSALPTYSLFGQTYVDDSIRADETQEPARWTAERAIVSLHPTVTDDLIETMRYSCMAIALRAANHRAATQLRNAEAACQAELVRCILGNPFAPTRLDPAWLTAHPALAQIAQAIYADRAFRELPILADALEEAGCVDESVLAHCRSIEPHARGCWVVDLVLGKE